MDEVVVIGSTRKKKLSISLFSGLLLLTVLLAVFGFSGTIFAVPLGGMGDFFVQFDKLEGEGFTLRPHIGETGNESDAPLVRNEIDRATIENLHIYKDLRLPAGGWVRIHVKASEPTIIQGLIQDARFVDANLHFSEMSIEQKNTSEMTPEELFRENWTHHASKITITDATIVTDYLFQNMVKLGGAQISLERISEPHTIDKDPVQVGSKSSSGTSSGSNDSSGAGKGKPHDGKTLPITASNIFFPFVIGGGLLIIGIVIFVFQRRKVRMIEKHNH